MVFKISGNIKIDNAYDIKEKMVNKIAECQKNNENELIIDFSNVDLIDSTGLGILVSILRRCNEKRINLSVRNLSEQVKKVFRLTMLDDVFDIE